MFVAPIRQCPERFRGIFGQNPSVSKSKRLHVAIFQFVFTKSRYIPYILLVCTTFVRSLELQPTILQTPPIHM